ncbi:MAG: NUDIX domain-containing protein [Bacteroidota bacterium]
MNRADLLKKLLPGFLPLFVFIAADEIWGTEVGIIVAVAFGIVQLIFTYFKEKRFDKFVLFDTLLIVLLGALSYILDSPRFILFKPVLIELILIVLLGLSAFTPYNFLLSMSKRYMKGVEINDQQVKQMTSSVRIMFFVFLAHTLLSVYSVFWMSSAASVFVTGGLFYIIFGTYFVFEILRTRFKRKSIIQSLNETEEMLPVVDEKGRLIGKAPRSVCHSGKKILHPVVHLHIVNKSKQIYLQKRPMNKLVQPGKWDSAVGGHVSVNEKIEDALFREAGEELGLNNFDPKLIAQYKWENELESELVFSFITLYNEPISYNRDEVDEGRFWSIKQIGDNIGKGILTPNFEHEFEILRKFILGK